MPRVAVPSARMVIENPRSGLQRTLPGLLYPGAGWAAIASSQVPFARICSSVGLVRMLSVAQLTSHSSHVVQMLDWSRPGPPQMKQGSRVGDFSGNPLLTEGVIPVGAFMSFM